MEALICMQKDLHARMSKAKTNYKKTPKDRMSQQYVEIRIEALDDLWSRFNDNHSNIVKLAEGKQASHSYFKDDTVEVVGELYFEHKTELKRALASYQSSNKNVTCVNSQPVDASSNSNLRLPPILVPVFSGLYTEWTTFRDLFVSLVHTNAQLDNVQKMHYLKGYLTGEAEQLLRQIPIADANYERCWTLLNSRYNNKRYLSHFLLKRLLSQKNITSESATCLKNLMDTTTDCLNSLTNLGIDVNNWDIIVIHILTLKLDAESRKQWEFNVTSNNSSEELPTLSQFNDFITKRYRALEFLDTKSAPGIRNSANVQASNNNGDKLRTLHASSKNQCQFCNEDHKLVFCKRFAQEPVDSRRNFVQNNNICFNCLGSNHSAKSCQNPNKCRVCKRHHHSLLHPKSSGISGTVAETNKDQQSTSKKENRSINNNNKGASKPINPANEPDDSSPIVSCCSTGKVRNQVLLATALVNAASKTGARYTIRALLDQGSQTSFVTEATAQFLGLAKIPIRENVSVLGGNLDMSPKSMVFIDLISMVDPSYTITVKAFVLKTITTFLPAKKVDALEWLASLEIELADPNYHTPNKIDVLLGAEVYDKVIQEGVKRGPLGSPVAQCTSFGWILSGEVTLQHSGNPSEIKTFHCRTDDNDLLKQFWELESDMDLTKQEKMTDEEKRCEELFTRTTKRDAEGRYIVRLPFKTDDPDCKRSSSLEVAEKRWQGLKRRLDKDKNFSNKYEAVMEEYLQLGHMEPVPESELKMKHAVYLPHHPVVREDKETTKLRIVLDASAKGKNGISLNDCLLVGPSLQDDLRHIMFRWRAHAICLVADIIKMYRQVWVSKQDVDFQRVIWKDIETNKDKHFRLLTVTFGTASAPYSAVKALQQVAIDEGKDFPVAAPIVLKDFYVDDLITGCESVKQAVKIYHEIKSLLSKGGFQLQKWSSNSNELLESISEGKEDIKDGLELKLDNIIKILGLTWERSSDSFRYSVNLPELQQPVTKRKILSDISRLYDPLGWAVPSVVLAKIMIQKLWLAGLAWDEEVPKNLLTEWVTYREELQNLSQVHVPRWLGTQSSDVSTELHGFCDASKVAYAAVVYIRVTGLDGRITSSLVTARTKVAPVKQIPRLELCGAVLLARLILEVAKVMKIDKTRLHAWTDSTVVLAWLNSHPSRWKVFVANRVSEILSSLDSHQWSHVSSKNNPADCASRGVSPAELKENKLWLQGPKFLINETIIYDKPKDIETDLEAIKTHCAVVDKSFIDQFSSLTRLIRVIAYCRRSRTRKSQIITPTTYLSSIELADALEVCIRYVQLENFSDEISALQQNRQLNKQSKLSTLNPFLDEKQLLRVGRRLEQSSLSRNRKHPILLPKHSHLTHLILLNAHKCTLHGGHQLMLNYLQSKYWIIGARQLVKATTRKCVTCVKNAAVTQNQLMGQLPAARATPCRPFKRSGVDYAGPIQIRSAKGRGHHAYKGYICLFVCMSTRAVRLEVVSDLTTQGFLQAFKRFVARRGHCQDIWSDNGSNFTGASVELKRLFVAESTGIFSDVAESLATNGTTWHFIPPHSPNFGGLWEAGVKSVKFHLKRVIGESTLTFEEMSTVLAQIEACLNSRPLSTIPNDPEDIVLTPAHFLVGESLVTPPDYNFEQANVSSLKRWQYTQRMLQDFWRKWSQEYLTKFLHRYRWNTETSQPRVGDVVIVKEDGLPPCKWLYGKIIETHPGLDKIVRVVTIRTKNCIFKRPTSKLCVLPIAD